MLWSFRNAPSRKKGAKLEHFTCGNPLVAPIGWAAEQLLDGSENEVKLPASNERIAEPRKAGIASKKNICASFFSVEYSKICLYNRRKFMLIFVWRLFWQSQ